MKLKDAERVFSVGAVLAGALFLAGDFLDRPGLFALGLGVAVLCFLFWFIVGRCPSCNRPLGRLSGKHCPHCGAKIKD